MIFNSVAFGFFFVVVFFTYWTVLKNTITARNIFIIAAGYLFYGWWDYRFLALLFVSSIVDYTVGYYLFRAESPRKRKGLLSISLVVQLGMLSFFKYYNFFVDSFMVAFQKLGVNMHYESLKVILPVGISFYTFQTLSYALDIYYRRLEPSKNLVNFLAFVSFFPPLVAGPIERAKHLLPQFQKPSYINYTMLRSGILLMAWGFFKKIVIADRLARYVDGSYTDINGANGLPDLVAVWFFALQLYLDFSAYSDIAMGSARLLGIELSPNFKRPYLSSTFSTFWSRWHISLSTWFRDYLYIPLGGNRGLPWKTKRNLMIVFLISGLWHGASWNFVIWGALNGLFVLLLDRPLGYISKTVPGKILGVLTVFLLWTISLIFFRAHTFDDAINMFAHLGFGHSENLFNFGLLETEFKFTMFLMVLLIFIEVMQENGRLKYERFARKNFIVRWAVYFLIVFSIIFLGSYGIGVNDSNFIYFQF